jgi:MarR family transcriptional regulator for hemolysin
MSETSLGFIIGMTRRMIVKKMNEALSENNIPLTLEQFVFLKMLRNNQDEASQQELSNLTGKDKSATLRTIDILEKKGMVVRHSVSGDRRKNVIAFTEKCEKLFDNVLQIEEETMYKLKKGINKEDYEAMVRVMQQIQNNANK